MFMLYAVVIGVAIGLVAGGRLERLAEVRLRWAPVALLGLVVQVALFADPIASAVGAWGSPIYVASTAAVLAAVLANLRLPGLPIIALGAASNLAAIVANGGVMPVSAGALAALGVPASPGFSNSQQLESVALAPLTDIFALPAWVPLSNVFSVGDVLIGLGVAVAIVAALRDARLDPSPTNSPGPAIRRA